MILDTPPWVPCPLCEEPYCVLHDQHAADCPCAGIDAWSDADLSPYASPVLDMLTPAAKRCVGTGE